MIVWLLHMGESLPVDRDFRPYRYSMLADALTEQGHEVLRWAPTFSHSNKSFRFRHEAKVDINSQYAIRFLRTPGYQKNVGVDRLAAHQVFVRRFRSVAHQEKTPDIILSGLPTPELARASVRISRQTGAVAVIDIRDLWPDVLKASGVGVTKVLTEPLIRHYRRQVAASLRKADAVTAISRRYLDWAGQYRSLRPEDAVFPMGYPDPALQQVQDLEPAGERFFRENRLAVAFIGTFSAQFDWDTVIRVVRGTDDAKVGFALIGDGPEADRVRLALRGRPNVYMPGWVGMGQLMRALQLSDVGWAPYGQAALMSMPNKIFEYMAGGLAVISTLEDSETRTTIREGNFGETISPTDDPSTVRLLADWARDRRHVADLGTRARRVYETSFSSSAVYRSMTAHLASLHSTKEAHRV